VQQEQCEAKLLKQQVDQQLQAARQEVQDCRLQLFESQAAVRALQQAAQALEAQLQAAVRALPVSADATGSTLPGSAPTGGTLTGIAMQPAEPNAHLPHTAPEEGESSAVVLTSCRQLAQQLVAACAAATQAAQQLQLEQAAQTQQLQQLLLAVNSAAAAA